MKMSWKSTPSHGYLILDSEMFAEMERTAPALLTPSTFYDGGMVFEEDCEWARVACAFPSRFTISEVKCAIRTMRNTHPDIYEAHTGRSVKLEHSHKKQARAFFEEHINDYVTVAAYGSWHKKVLDGYVGVTAVRGGRNPETGHYATNDIKNFLVRAEKFQARKETYVIQDEDIPCKWEF